MPLQATSGAASYDAFGGGVAVVPNYIEDVFSTFLYNGAGGSSLAINNGIDLAGKGGLVWIKSRSTADYGHALHDTARGLVYRLMTNNTNAQNSEPGDLASFNSNGFTTGGGAITNDPAQTYASWTFRKQPKFFDVVTYTGNGVDGRTVAHNLGAVPGCIIVKRTDAASDWAVYHRGLTAPADWRWLKLNTTDAQTAASAPWNDTAPTSTNFTVDSSAPVNASGGTYVAYLFAHNAGGFGLSGTDNVISCGSFTTNGSGAATVDLGYEPQWILCKPTSSTGDWFIADNMRGFSLTSTATLYPNSSSAENGLITFSEAFPFSPTATGFTTPNALLPSRTYIYIAIRRGPMRTPTTGTSVFSPYAATTPGQAVVTTGFPVDFQIQKNAGAATDIRTVDRLRGVSTTPTSPSAAFPFLVTNTTNAESTGTGTTLNWNNTGFTVGATYESSAKAWAVNFRRAPGFFDEVCWTGDNTTSRSISHNLQAAPELIIRKSRSASGSWSTLTKFETSTYIELNLNSASEGSVRSYAANQYLSAKPTSTVFTVNPSYENDAGVTYVSYLFATCPGVSKVGFYTGTGTTQTINCGFTAGSRFVLIKRYDPDFSGDWYVWDSARGIVAGNDPYLLLNSTAAEVTNTDFIDTASTGFEISSTAPAAINASGGTFIFLAIA